MKKPGQLFNTSADLQMSDVRKGEVEDVFFVADWVGFFFKKHRENGISLPDFEGFFPAG